jgi:predicted DNA-binding protein
MSPKPLPGKSPRIRTNFYLTMIQVDRLKKMSAKTGLSASEILRRAIDEYWEREGKKK